MAFQRIAYSLGAYLLALSGYQGFGMRTAQIGRQAHPDVLANIISQEIVYHSLLRDENARLDVNVGLGNDCVWISGQIGSKDPLSKDEIRDITAKTIRSIDITGYYDPNAREIRVDIDRQSPNIACSVDGGGAGDTVVKHAIAANETENYLPLATVLVKNVARQLDMALKNSEIEGLREDGKLNIKVKYRRGEPEYVSGMVIAAQHYPGIDLKKFRACIEARIVVPSMEYLYYPERTELIINGAERFEHASPVADRGVKGKKDHDAAFGDEGTPSGGSAYGKDPTKVDFHDWVMGRYIGKNLVAAGLASWIEVKVGHRIGQDKSWILDFDTKGTTHVPNVELERIVRRNFPLTPKEIIEELGLRQPWIFRETERQFFGDPRLPWERIIKLDGV